MRCVVLGHSCARRWGLRIDRRTEPGITHIAHITKSRDGQTAAVEIPSTHMCWNACAMSVVFPDSFVAVAKFLLNVERLA